MQSGAIKSTSMMSEDDVKLIETQLNDICASKYFKSAKKMQQFLSFIVKKTLDGEEKTLKQYTIGVEALSLAENFNPNENPTIRILGGRVRRRLAAFYEDENQSRSVIINLPKGSYIPQFKTASDTKKAKQSTASSSKTVTPKTFQYHSQSCPTLALLSFTDKTESDDTNRFLLEFTDSLVTELSRFIGLQVCVKNPYGDKEQSRLAEEEVKSGKSSEYVLVLLMQKPDVLDYDFYRLTYRLVWVTTGEILWSESYVISDKSLDAQYNIIEKLIARVGDETQGIVLNHWSGSHLTNEDKMPSACSVLVYYRKYIIHHDYETFSKGVEICLKALEKNPENIIALITYAIYCRHDYVFDYDLIEDPLKKGLKSAEVALRLGPSVHEAHIIYAMLLYSANEWDRSLEEFEIGRNISKNSMFTEFVYGFQLAKMGRWDEGVSIFNKVMLNSNIYPSYYHVVPSFDAYRKEKYELALVEAKKITTIGLIYGPLARCVSFAGLNRLDEAKEELQEITRRYPRFMEKGQLQLTRYFCPGELVNKIWSDILKVINHCN